MTLVGLLVGETADVGSIGIHDEDIVVAIGVGDKGDLCAIRGPDRVAVVVAVVCDLFGC